MGVIISVFLIIKIWDCKSNLYEFNVSKLWVNELLKLDIFCLINFVNSLKLNKIICFMMYFIYVFVDKIIEWYDIFLCY